MFQFGLESFIELTGNNYEHIELAIFDFTCSISITCDKDVLHDM
jgi:hypothetical protein